MTATWEAQSNPTWGDRSINYVWQNGKQLAHAGFARLRVKAVIMCIVEEPDGEVHGDLNAFTSRTTHPTHRSGRLHVGLYALESRIKDLLGLAGNTGGRIIHDIYAIHDFGASRLLTSVSSHCDLAFDPPLRHVLDCRGLASANIATRSPSYVQYQSRRSSAEIRLACNVDSLGRIPGAHGLLLFDCRLHRYAIHVRSKRLSRVLDLLAGDLSRLTPGSCITGRGS